MWINTGKLTGRNQLPSWLSGNEPSYQYRRHKSHGFEPWVGKTLEEVWQPNAVFLAAESHGQRAWQSTVHGVTIESDSTEAT